MAVVTVRPTSVDPDEGWGAFPSGTVLDVISDGDDATYAHVPLAQGRDEGLRLVRFPASLPAGAAVDRVRMAARMAGEGAAMGTILSMDGQHQVMLWVPESSTTVESLWLSSHPAGGGWTPSGIAALGAEVELVGTFGSTGGRVHDVWLDVEYFTRPTALLTGPPQTVTDTTRPTLSWGYGQADGLPQTERVLIVREQNGPNVWYNREATSANEFVLPVDLDNGKTYVATLTVHTHTPSGHVLASVPTTHTFSLDLNTPDPPQVDVTPHPAGGRTLLEITDPVGAIAAEWISVVYRDDGDESWTTLRAGGQLDPTGGPILLWDHEPPFNQERTYRVRGHAIIDELEVASSAVDRTVTLDGTGRWLTDPRDPAGLHAEVLTADHERTFQGREQVHLPAGLGTAVVESEPTVLHQTLSVWALDPEQHATLIAALRSTRTLLYRDWRTSVYFRWVGDRTAQQHGLDYHQVDRLSGTMVEVRRPPS